MSGSDGGRDDRAWALRQSIASFLFRVGSVVALTCSVIMWVGPAEVVTLMLLRLLVGSILLVIICPIVDGSIGQIRRGK